MGTSKEDLTLNPRPTLPHHMSLTAPSISIGMPTPVFIRLFIVADYPVVRHGLRQIFGGAMDIQIVDEARGAGDAIARMTACHPDAVLLDFAGKASYHVFCQLQKHHRPVPILIFGAARDRYAKKAFKRGAMGYLTKDHVPDHLVLAVRQIARGEKYLLPTIVPRLQGQFSAVKVALLASLSWLFQPSVSSPPEIPPLHR